jgi:outer membrane protein assembly factor BamB
VVRFAGNNPTLVWENKEMRNHMNSCVLINDKLYGFDEGDLKCLDFATGKVLWKEGSLGKGALMASDGKLIVISEKGELVIAPADPAAFKPVARAQILGGKCWTTPVLSHGRVYARNAKGDLVCVSVK